MSDSDGDTPMPSGSAPARNTNRHARSHSDDDAGSPSSADHLPARKRVKLDQATKPKPINGKGKARMPDSDQSGHDESSDDDHKPVRRDGADDDFGQDERQHLVRHDDGYVTGSIVRIACHSFLTYDSVEFRPGPALNMIIGPNGTGKSTIACAIAIGLGFPAKVLGRSTKLSAYCKNDSNESTWIELELKGKPGDNNLVVRRYLSRDSEKTRFELDGNEATSKAVMEHMEELQVQVGNLCTFLPQDRVASFAMMTPPELLRETQHAAGNENLTKWHQVLIAEYKHLKESQIEVARLSDVLTRKQTKQAEAEKEVRAFEQRERLEQDRAVVEVLVKFAEYNKVYNEYDTMRGDRDRCKNEVSQLEEVNRPFRASVEALDGLVKACRKEQDKVDKKVHNLFKDADSFKTRLDKLDNDRNTVSEAITDIKRTENERRKRVNTLEIAIAKLTDLVADEPAEANTADLDRQINALSRNRNEIASQIQERQNERSEIERQADEFKLAERTYGAEIEKQQQVATQRERNLKQWDPDTWKAVQWLRANKAEFRGRVYEPARLSMSMKKQFGNVKLDARYADLVEGPIPLSAINTILFEFREDYDRMMKILTDEPNRRQPKSGISFNGAEVTGIPSVDEMERPLSADDLAKFGFDCYAIDLLEGPPAVLSYLAHNFQLHRIPMQLSRRPVDARGIEATRRIQRYYTPDGSSSIKFSMYGQRLAQLEARPLSRAKVLGNGVDQARIDHFVNRVSEAKASRAALKGDFDRSKEVEQELVEQVKQIETEREELHQERVKMHKAHATWVKNKSKLDTAQKQLDRELAKPSAAAKRAQLNDELRKLVDKRVKAALGYADSTAQAADSQEGAIKVALQALQAESDFRALDAQVRERNVELEEKKAELEQITVKVKAALVQGKKLYASANAALEDADEEVSVRVKARQAEDALSSHQELNDELGELDAQLGCMGAVSPIVLEAYNKRKVEIADQQAKLDSAQERLDESQQIITTTENLWRPRLDRLISDISAKFTTAFDTLGLLGEVRLATEDDYEKWGIEIMVSFRDRKDDSQDVTLHVLSGQRQSGGERALTTVTYLLALAELARAPFALVDEINQGMDQRAERNMHKMLVETTCSHDVGQYFLLTPKLLPDLVYHPKMKVLVINVSPYVPSDLTFQGILDKKRELVRKRKNGARAVLAN
ncbi:uncharacterized protein RHOBADRAFT_51796 [Rhodotorula graminis WP1]|uniref:Structural maintenance of chromosomes protein 5 n=1 Tax=Rhodotorula graminis (strain WP1) TaxID=578459 RepID=A0A194SBM2_RHOGW|nr:uncharacterized protein RHOBADRAFT_51796 [Rhodotorula graminis WP1]KPV76806.1 hypothetical protein RHOBADRAFT_51796 [Rhodotorula graminis WP1]